MNTDHMVKMVNEISAFFAAEAADQAPQMIATHLKRYWEPRMRQQIVAYYHKGGGGLVDAARSAVAILAAEAPK